jgi:hypothetical protein
MKEYCQIKLAPHCTTTTTTALLSGATNHYYLNFLDQTRFEHLKLAKRLDSIVEEIRHFCQELNEEDANQKENDYNVKLPFRKLNSQLTSTNNTSTGNFVKKIAKNHIELIKK